MTEPTIMPEEAAALWEQFSADVENGLPVKAYDEWANMDGALDDALRKALAVQRERERWQGDDAIRKRELARLRNVFTGAHCDVHAPQFSAGCLNCQVEELQTQVRRLGDKFKLMLFEAEIEYDEAAFDKLIAEVRAERFERLYGGEKA